MSDPTTTRLLVQVSSGDRSALDALYERVYDSLREIAHHRLAEHRRGTTLATTALVHEAYIRLIDLSRVDLKDKAHFCALSSRVMRSVLVDHARARMTKKRGGGERLVPLDAVQVAADDRAADVVALDEALKRLGEHDERLSSVVEYRFFGGLSFDEIAAVSGRSVSTLKRDWARARIWLQRMMQEEFA